MAGLEKSRKNIANTLANSGGKDFKTLQTHYTFLTSRRAWTKTVHFNFLAHGRKKKRKKKNKTKTNTLWHCWGEATALLGYPCTPSVVLQCLSYFQLKEFTSHLASMKINGKHGILLKVVDRKTTRSLSCTLCGSNLSERNTDTKKMLQPHLLTCWLSF